MLGLAILCHIPSLFVLDARGISELLKNEDK